MSGSTRRAAAARPAPPPPAGPPPPPPRPTAARTTRPGGAAAEPLPDRVQRAVSSCHAPPHRGPVPGRSAATTRTPGPSEGRRVCPLRKRRCRRAGVQEELMRILVIGAGATGGYFGARLAQAGRDVTFLLRPARAAAVRANGIKLTGQGPDEAVPVTVVTASEINGPYDLVLVTVKNGALESAMDDMTPAVGPGTLIVPFLNGLSHLDRLNGRFGASAVLGGVVIVATTVNQQGDIVRLAPQASPTTGAPPGNPPTDTTGVAAALGDVRGFDFALPHHLLADMWSKWVFIATLGAFTCLMRGAVGEIVAQPGGDKLGPA